VARPGGLTETDAVRLTTAECWDRLGSAEHGVLCTTNASGAIDAVPTCLAVVGGRIATPIDTVKPKATTELARRTNLDRDPGGTLLCEHWDAADWSRLWWVRARLVYVPVPVHDVDEYEAALRARYPQYRTARFAAVLVFDVADVVGWSAAG
jgi:hypothetical protein